MDQSLKTCLKDISDKSNLVSTRITELMRKNLTQPAIDFFKTNPGEGLLKRVEKKLIEEATKFDTKESVMHLDFSTSKEVEEVMKFKNEIIIFLKDEIGIEILHWHQKMAPMQNSMFLTMRYM
jgi:C4-type Zn-finger protein